MRVFGVCNHNNETVVFCHAPSPLKGTGTKSDDFWGAHGCSNCHEYVDTHNINETAAIWLSAIFETQKRLIEKGLIKI